MHTNQLTQSQFTDLISSRVRKGFNRFESIGKLAEALRAHEGENLVNALVYEGFATEAYARQLLKYLQR